MVGCVFGLILLAVAALGIVSQWKVFVKAGQPGWACLIPIYNFVIMCRIAGKPGWWVLLLLIPIVDIVILIMVLNGMSKHFGHGVGMTLLLIFLPIIAYPVLAFGDSRYAPV
jgi:hypothetical protein